MEYLFLAFYPGILSDILFWHSIFSDLSGIYTDIFSGILSAIFSGTCAGMLSGKYSGILFYILFWHSIWHPFWHRIWFSFLLSFSHSFWHSIWNIILAFSLTCAEVPSLRLSSQSRSPLRSGARVEVQLRSSSAHCVLELAVELEGGWGRRRKEEEGGK